MWNREINRQGKTGPLKAESPECTMEDQWHFQPIGGEGEEVKNPQKSRQDEPESPRMPGLPAAAMFPRTMCRNP